MRWIAALYSSLRTLMIATFASSGVAQAQQPADADDRAWEAAQSAGTTDAFQRYLEQYPIGRHAEDAFRSLIEERTESELGGATRGIGVDMY